jgi:geranylgeranyl pyrophosphate synthase
MLALIASYFGRGQHQKVIEAAIVYRLTQMAALYDNDVINNASDARHSSKTPEIVLNAGIPTSVTIQILNSTDPADRALREKISTPLPEAEFSAVIKEPRVHRALAEAKNHLRNVTNESKTTLVDLPDKLARQTLEHLYDAIPGGLT